MFRFGRWLHLAWRILAHPLPRYLASWAIVLYVGYYQTYEAWTYYNVWHFDAGTRGHATVDFGGQWFTGKLLLEGKGRYLYERHAQWEVIREYYPPERTPHGPVYQDRCRLGDWLRGKEWGKWKDHRAPELLASYLLPLGSGNNLEAAVAAAGAQVAQKENRQWFVGESRDPYPPLDQAGDMMSWLLGEDNTADRRTRAGCLLPLASQDPLAALAAAGQQEVWTPEAIENASKRRVGGQVYPPIHAFLYVPFDFLPPAPAYRVAEIVPLLLALFAGWGLTLISAGRLWWPISTLLCIVVPGFHDAMTLGHNGSFIVAALVWGYYFLHQNRDLLGGAVWGLIAYKPSWAVTYFLMLVVARRWRAALGMGLCAVAQILLTLPLVGVHSWLEWRQVVSEANAGYGEVNNWIHHSRDMLSIPRRLLNDRDAAYGTREPFEARLIGYMLLGAVLEATVRLTTLRVRRDKRWTHAGAAFLLLGFWMCTYHITYYDTMFTTLPLALLLLVPAHPLVPYFLQRLRATWSIGGPADGATLELSRRNYGAVCNPLIVVLLPLVVWNPIGIKVSPWVVQRFWYGPQQWFGKAVPEVTEGYLVDLPFIIVFFLMLWAWAGYWWLREGTAAAAQQNKVVEDASSEVNGIARGMAGQGPALMSQGSAGQGVRER